MGKKFNHQQWLIGKQRHCPTREPLSGQEPG